MDQDKNLQVPEDQCFPRMDLSEESDTTISICEYSHGLHF